jgi:hypothetical protein
VLLLSRVSDGHAYTSDPTTNTDCDPHSYIDCPRNGNEWREARRYCANEYPNGHRNSSSDSIRVLHVPAELYTAG